MSNETERAAQNAQFYQKALSLYNQQRFQEAVILLEEVTNKILAEAIDATAQDIEIFRLLGVTYAQLQAHEDALYTFNEALYLTPDNTELLSHKGITLLLLKRTEEALKCFMRIIQLEPGNVTALYNQGRCLFYLGNTSAALLVLEHVVSSKKLPPYGHSQALDLKATCLLQLERLPEALDTINQALTIHDQNASAWGNKGAILFKLQRFPEAIDAFNTSLHIDPNMPTQNRIIREKVLAALGRSNT